MGWSNTLDHDLGRCEMSQRWRANLLLSGGQLVYLIAAVTEVAWIQFRLVPAS
jgi:hypothetical protein